MSEGELDPRWADAMLAADLLAADPAGLGGAVIRTAAGPARDAWLARFGAALPAGAPVRRLPPATADDRLLGGLDLAATLVAGRPVAGRGVLAEADGGAVVVPMAERLPPGTAARIAGAIDTAAVATERDGLAIRDPARFGLVLLDEGLDDERAPFSLADRCAFWIDLPDAADVGALLAGEAERPLPGRRGAAAPDRAAPPAGADPRSVDVPDEAVEALCRAALGAGIASVRAPLLAVRASRGLAALAGRDRVTPEDVAGAARLVLAPRATAVPETAPAPEATPQEMEARGDEAPEGGDREDGSDPETDGGAGDLDEMVIEAVRAGLPARLLDALAAGAAPPAAGRAGPGGSGQARKSRLRGRPAGTVRGLPVRGARLAVVETLRAAAPWQPVRRRAAPGRLAIRPDDLRVTRFRQRTETTAIFVVDASGSAAFHRLAEAKGAVELLLADCYVRRDRVALIAFRGDRADLLLPPTRSLARAKRSLAALPGGGGTPLALAIDAAGRLAAEVARAGGAPLAVFLTDGRANVARDGAGGRDRAGDEARAAARALRLGGCPALLVDTAVRPGPAAAAIADAMGARYLPLPGADARSLSRVVGSAIAASSAP